MLKNFKSERERLEKEIERNKKKAYSYIELEGDVQASIKDMQFHILVKELQAKLTQLNECEEICREEIDKKIEYLKDYKNVGFYVEGEVKALTELKQNLFGGEK